AGMARSCTHLDACAEIDQRFHIQPLETCLMSTSSDFIALRLCVLTVSDSRAANNDTSGDYLVEQLQAAGHLLHARALLPDERYRLRAQVSQWIADEAVDGVLITGGTGFTGRDSTPEALA